MKENIKERYDIKIGNVLQSLKGILFHIGFAAGGFLTANSGLLGAIRPLGLAFACGTPKCYTLSAGIGAFIGYLLLILGGGSFKYIAALFAIVCIKLLSSHIKPVTESPMWSAIIGFSSAAITGLVALASGVSSGGALALAEAVIVGAGAYFAHRTFKHNFADKSGISNEDLAAIIITINILLMGLYPLKIGELSLGKILSIVLILSASKCMGSAGGAICGIATSLSVMLAGGDSFSAFVFSLAGLVSGFCAPIGKAFSSISFVVICLVSTVFSGFNSTVTAVLLESLIAAVIFLLLPKTVYIKIGSLFSSPSNIQNLDGLRKALVMRLDFASSAMQGVSDTVDEVSKKLSEKRTPDFISVLSLVEHEACRGCSFGINCWEKNSNETYDAMIALSNCIKSNEPMSLANLPSSFAERCLRRERVENSLYHHYSDFTARLAAEQRITEMREVVSDQFLGISDMLSDLSVEFEKCQLYDMETAKRITAALKELDMRASDCGCSIDKYGRMSIEIRLKQPPSLPFSRSRVLSKIEEICEREFEPPAINKVGNEHLITLTEKAVYAVDYAVSQFSCGENKLCGDATDCFYDGKGHLLMILSDGMGTGGRAAVDGNMAVCLMSRLLKSGFGYDCSLRIVNSAMLFKSTDESLATVDISSIDLFTGSVELLKAGAAPTLVRRNGRTGKAQCHCLPAGILREVGFDKAVVTIKEDDIILMMSDGVISEGTDWIYAELEAFQDGSAKQLAEHIANAARRRRTDGHSDDITVMAAILDKAI